MTEFKAVKIPVAGSVVGPGCLSRILIFTHPGCRSRIPDPNTATKERDEKKFVIILFFVVTIKFHKIESYFIFEIPKKKKLGQFSKNY